MGVTVRRRGDRGHGWVVTVHHEGRRIRRTRESEAEARALADELESIEASGGDPTALLPTFGELADDYRRRGMGHLAPSTREDHDRALRDEGVLGLTLGPVRLDRLTERALRDWWRDHVEGGARTTKTGRNLLTIVSDVLAYAAEDGIDLANPVPGVRAWVRRRSRTKGGRRAPEPRPIERDRLGALVEASAAQSADAHLLTLLQLDAALRLGEACGGVRWSAVWWGRGASDPTRSLLVSEALARGRHAGTPKSGRERRVELSRRLYRALRERWIALGQPQDEPIVELDPDAWRRGAWRRICTAAELGHRRPTDLRDSYACHLLMAGIPLGYISRQMGHSSPYVTAQHYARWQGDAYREPPRLRPGDVPADLLARTAEAAAVAGGAPIRPQ